jgi:pimeloyl-ACP methyl ester carboxylesterase
MQTLTLGNRTLMYRSYGHDVDPARPPLVLLHGAGGTHLVWPAQLRHLERTCIYALDLPGHGASPGPGCANISAYSEIVRDFVDALELPWFVLAGHSMGAAIALDFALAYGQRMAGIAVVGAGARMRVSPVLLDGILHDFHGTTELIVNYSYHASTSDVLKEIYLRHLRENDAHVLYGDLVACHHFDIVDRLDELCIPTLIICGRQDQMTPAERSIYLHNHITNSELQILDPGGHNVMVEQPDTVADLVAGFLDTLTEPAN